MSPRINEVFCPNVRMKSLYYTYLVLGVVAFGLSWMVPTAAVATPYLSLNEALVLSASLFVPLIIFVLFTAYWIPRYYSSIRYLLTEDEIVVERGVYWKRKSFVPYNRITNINVVQGPLVRRLGLGTVRIQTAGFSGSSTGTRVAEAVVLNVENFEELKDTIMVFVRRLRPVAVEAEPAVPEGYGNRILDELRRIREVLERG